MTDGDNKHLSPNKSSSDCSAWTCFNTYFW